MNVGAQQKLFRHIHEIYLTELPFIMLYRLTDISMVREGTHNYLPSTIVRDIVNIWKRWCDNGKC